MIRNIVRWPNPILKNRCAAMDNTGDAGDLAQDLKDTLEASGGIGLAANQIGVDRAVCIVNLTQQGPKVFINPKVISAKDWELVPEGCLSIPGIVKDIKRPKTVVVEYFDPASMEYMKEEFEGRDAQALSHEIDHLEGKVFIDYLKPGERDQIRNYLRKVR